MSDLSIYDNFSATAKDPEIPETADQEAIRLIAPRGRTPDEADMAGLYKNWSAIGDSDYPDASVDDGADALAAGPSLFGSAPVRDPQRPSHKVVSAFESKEDFQKATDGLSNRPMQSITHWKPSKKAEPYLDLASKAEKDNDLPDNFVLSLLKEESEFKNSAKSSKGAKGVAQIVPKWHPDVKDYYDVEETIPYAGKLLRQHLDEFGSLEAALAAYNAGPTYTRAHLKKNGGEIDMDSLWKETREYIQGIMGRIHTEKQG